MGVDAVISPATPTTSHKPTEGRYFGYTGVWNVLDYSAVAIRAGTKVDKERDAVVGTVFLNPLDEEVGKQCKLFCSSALWRAELHGLIARTR